MKVIFRVSLMIICTGDCISINAQTTAIDTTRSSFTVDTSKNSFEVQGSFNGAEIHLPEAKTPPEYPGGLTAWHSFLKSNINIAIPFKYKVQPGTYRVMTRFIVGSDGKLYNIGAESNNGYGMESEVIRCIQKSGEWKPAVTGSGRKVAFTLRMIVIFTVKHNDIIVSFQ